MSRRRVIVAKEELERALAEFPSAYQACQSLGLMYTTFIRRCKEYGIYVTNQGGRGMAKPNPKARIPLEKIFNGEHLMFGQKLKNKMLDAGIIEDVCDECGIGPTWNAKKLVLQIDHIDGDRLNNARENLRILCPNCHSQTETFSRGKNKLNARVGELADPQR